MRPASLLSVALPCLLAVCSCRRDSTGSGQPPPPPPSAPAASVCEPLAPEAATAWTTKPLPFGQIQVPASWRDTPVRGGFEVRDAPRHRRVFFSEVVFPASASLSPRQAIDRVLKRVRPRLAKDGVQLAPVTEVASPTQPAVSFLSTANGRSIFSAIVARATTDSGVRLVSVTYEEDVPLIEPSCVDNHAGQLLRRIVVSDAVVGEGHGAAAASLVRFTPGAQAELARQMKQGDTIWIAAQRSPAQPAYQLELRPPDDLPADALRDRVDGIPIAIERNSIELVDGATIDYSADGGGFVFSNPGAQ